ncbi:MAG: AAA family ATPase [Acidobacteria bacterium]|nr:AAA family ATPase [Acidobacteriota bacterium]
MTAHQKLTAIKEHLNNQFIERESLIDTALLALLIQEHMLILGLPGTAKSDLVTEIAKCLQRSYFIWPMSKTTTPEELFGPYSIPELKNGRYIRITTGKLPQTQIAFLDEVGKAGGVIQNTLLRAMNEKCFDDGTGDKPIPLETLFGASNEMLEEEEQQAFFDRFLFRQFSAPVTDGKFKAFLKLVNRSRPAAPTISDQEIGELRQQTASVQIPETIFESAFKIKKKLAAIGITPSDRRWGKCLKALKGNAVMSNRAVIEDEDLLSLQHILPTLPQDYAAVKSTILEFTFPMITKALEIKDEAQEAHDKYKDALSRETDTEKQTSLHIAIAKKLEGFLKKIEPILTQSKGKTEVLKIKEQIASQRESVLTEVIGSFSMNN